MDDAHSKAESASPALGADFELAVRTLITEIGEDPERQGLIGTPARVRRMYGELTDGYRADPDTLINNACYDVDYDEMVVVRDIEFFSLCEHHLLPFYGHAHVGYLPRGRVIGLSKIPRIVDLYAHRLQVQERLTQQVAELLMERLNPKGVACVVEATHLCTMMRGVRKQRATMVTSAMLGTFRRDPKTRGEFLTFIGRPTSLGA
ncbi:MAG TPA: GTP cyclohydrolase I FolE [Candidatus Limnocylindria bacterium]|nr:GTP cyclohydrolase I FolE [Candidatus Limnocylindria bacterium]